MLKYKVIYTINIFSLSLTITILSWLYTIGYLENRDFEYLPAMWVIGILALLILTVSATGYISTSLLSINNRLKEFGVKKTIGSGNSRLIQQYTFDVGLQLLVAIFLSVGQLAISNQDFQLITGLHTDFGKIETLLSLAVVLIPVLGVAALTIGLVGTTITKINPIKIFQRQFSYWVTSNFFGTILVVIQFAIAFILMSSTLAISGHLQAITDAQLLIDNSQVNKEREPQYIIKKRENRGTVKTNLIVTSLISVKNNLESDKVRVNHALKITQSDNQVTPAELMENLKILMQVAGVSVPLLVILALTSLIVSRIKSKIKDVGIRKALGAMFGTYLLVIF